MADGDALADLQGEAGVGVQDDPVLQVAACPERDLVAVATHDEWLVAEALRLIEERGLGRERYEFQMLLGVCEDLADELARDGHTLRVYVPYGRRWYEYSLRRLQENPKVAGYLARDTLRRLKP